MAGTSDSSAHKVARTFFRSFGGFSYGMAMGMLGPNIPDLCTRQSVSVEQLSWVLSSSYAFMMAASLIQGGILDRLLPRRYHDYYYSGTSLVLAVVTFVKSRTSSFWVFAVVHIIENMSYTAYDILLDSNMLEMWGSRADPAIQLWHFGWAFGFSVGPLIVRAYFPDEAGDVVFSTKENDLTGHSTRDANHGHSGYSTYVMQNLNDSSAPALSYIANLTTNASIPQDILPIAKSYIAIEMPFTIASLCFLAIAVVNIAFICKGRSSVKVERKVQVHTNQWRDSRGFVITMCVMLVLFYFCVGGVETVFHTWVFSYAMVSDLNFTKPEAALLDSTSKFVLAGSKLVFTPLSMVVPCQVLLMLEVVGCLAVVIPLAMIGTRSKTHLWSLCCVFNVLAGPMWGAFKGWLDKYVVITPAILGLLYIGVGTSGMIFQGVSGYIMMTDPGALMYLIVAYNSMLLVVTITMQVRASCHGNRYAKQVVGLEVCEADDVANGVKEITT